MKISDNEKIEFEKAFPYLKIEWDSSIKGNIFFYSYYNKDTHEFYCDSSSVVCYDQKYHIKWRYEISIILPKNRNDFVIVKEIWWKLWKVLKNKQEKNILFKKEDLHINPDNTLCLSWPKTQQYFIKNGLNLAVIMCNLIIPYFYEQRFFELHNEWPRWELPHWEAWRKAEIADLYKKAVGKISLILWISWESIKEERYVYELIENTQKPKWHHNCICGSKQKFRSCHKEWFQKLWSRL